MPVRVLQVITDTDRRGAQIFATDLEAALNRPERPVRTVALTAGSVGGLAVRTLGPTRFSLSTLRALRSEIRSVDIVIAHGSSTLPACAATTLGTRRPFLYRQVSDSLFWASTVGQRLRVGVSLSRAERVVALWPGAAEALRTRFGVSGDRLRVIPNAVPEERVPRRDPTELPDRRRHLGLDPLRPVAACIGALVPEKGVDLAIEAISRLPEVQLVVVGDGAGRVALEHQAARVAPGRVVFTGSLEDSVSVLGAADVVIFPSRGGDSLPAVLIEAGLAEVPVVAADLAGIAEIVVEGVTGRLVPPDSSASIAAAIESLLSNPSYAQALGQQARDHCLHRFAMGVVAPAWDHLLNEVSAALGRSS